MKVTQELAEAVKRLRTNTDFAVVIESISDYGEQLVEQMIYAQDGGQLRTLQGNAQAVTKILKAVHIAPEKFGK